MTTGRSNSIICNIIFHYDSTKSGKNDWMSPKTCYDLLILVKSWKFVCPGCPYSLWAFPQREEVGWASPSLPPLAHPPGPHHQVFSPPHAAGPPWGKSPFLLQSWRLLGPHPPQSWARGKTRRGKQAIWGDGGVTWCNNFSFYIVISLKVNGFEWDQGYTRFLMVGSLQSKSAFANYNANLYFACMIPNSFLYKHWKS